MATKHFKDNMDTKIFPLGISLQEPKFEGMQWIA